MSRVAGDLESPPAKALRSLYGDRFRQVARLIDPKTPTLVVLPRDELFAKNISTIEEIRARRHHCAGRG